MDPSNSGGACVVLEGSVNAAVEPSASLFCVEGDAASLGYLSSLQEGLDYSGCPLDSDPLDGYSLGTFDFSSQTTEVCAGSHLTRVHSRSPLISSDLL